MGDSQPAEPDELSDEQILALPRDKAIAALAAAEGVSAFEAGQMLEALGGGDVFSVNEQGNVPPNIEDDLSG